MANVDGVRREPELTARAVVAGALLGVVFAVGNVYVGLKTGLVDAATVTVAILGFAFFHGLGRRSYGALENNITQNVASSAAVMPAAMGLLGSFPALAMLGSEYAWWLIVTWGLAIALLGIALALPLRDRFLSDATMPFPFAVATADVIRAMHRSGADAAAKARALLSAGAVSAIITWFRDGFPRLIPSVVYAPADVAGVAAKPLSLGMSVSPLLLALGMLVGPRTGLGLLLGGVLAWAVIAPSLVLTHAVAEASYGALSAWLMWPGSALMVAGAITSVLRDGRLFLRSLRDLRAVSGARADRNLAGFALLAVGIVLLGWLSFGVSPLLVLAAIGISLLMAVVATRSIGETGVLPLLTVGQLTQLILGPATRAPGASVVAASIPAGDCGQTGQTLETLKVGQMLGASPRSQIRAQLVGALIGAPFAATAYVVLTRAHALGGAELPAPTASPWKVTAELVAHGTAGIPAFAGVASLVALVVGASLALLERTRVSRFVPSPLAIGLAFLLGASAAFTMAAGALVRAVLQRAKPKWADDYGSSIAVGGLVGEALVGILVAALLVRHVLGP